MTFKLIFLILYLGFMLLHTPNDDEMMKKMNIKFRPNKKIE